MAKSRYFEMDLGSDEEAEERATGKNKKKGNKREETYVSIGTPLPEIEDFDAAAKQDTRPVIQARVHGEKILHGSDMPRLHGAFTGGFSAGYFNTVGSKEGFVPSAFMSSRQQRAQLKDQKAADYMDEEDFSEHGIAPREVRASETFSSMTRAEKNISETTKRLPSTVIPELASSIASLVSPVDSNIGIRLLMSMGWRRGQGAGPCTSVAPLTNKSSFSAKSGESSSKIYGCSLPAGFILPEGSDDSAEEAEQQTIPRSEFAPSDFAPYSYVPKSDVHGLGYSGMNADEATIETPSALLASAGKRGIRGQAFGVGFEGDDPEDTDVYGTDSLKNYDFVLDDKDEKNEAQHVFSGWTAPALMPPVKATPTAPGSIAGFAPSKRAFFRRQSNNLPKLPPNYKPIRGYISKDTFTASMTESVGSRSRFDQREVMTAATRAAILESGDDSSIRLEAKSSVFDYIRPEDKLKFDAAVAASKQGTESTEYKQVEVQTISSAPLKPFDPRKPFAIDEEKQSRYEAFLQFKQINKGYSDLDLPTGMTEWEQQQEREQFERAARLLQPLSWSISQRFTRASAETTADDDTTVEVNRDDVSDNLAEKKQAVKLKMFGKLTRSVLEWHPAPLLCKRFNIRNPYPDSQLVGLPKVRKSKFSIFNFLNVSETASPSSSMQSKTEPKSEPEGENQWQEEVAEKETTISEEIEQAEEKDERPSMDIFAAIFGEESESGGEPKETEEPAKVHEEPPEKVELPPETRVIAEPVAPPTPVDSEHTRREEGISAFLAGIFGSQAAKPVQRPPEPKPLPTAQVPKQAQNIPDEFGPKLPLHLIVGVPSVHDTVVVSDSSSYSDEDVQLISSSDSQREDEAVKEEKKSSKVKAKKKHHKEHRHKHHGASSNHHGKKKHHHKKDSKKHKKE